MWKAIKKYDWAHLISDLIVILVTTALAFFLERLKAFNFQELGPIGAGGLGFFVNKIRLLC